MGYFEVYRRTEEGMWFRTPSSEYHSYGNAYAGAWADTPENYEKRFLSGIIRKGENGWNRNGDRYWFNDLLFIPTSTPRGRMVSRILEKYPHPFRTPYAGWGGWNIMVRKLYEGVMP